MKIYYHPISTTSRMLTLFAADTGLKALALRRTDATVNYRWDFAAPHEILPPLYYMSIRDHNWLVFGVSTIVG